MSNPLYYPNRDMLASGFPTNWTLLKRLMWVRIMRGGSIAPTYETVTGNPVAFQTVRAAPLRKLSIAFSPVQDLHGQTNPWPAGSTKNLFKSTEYRGGYNNDVGVDLKVPNPISYKITNDGKFQFTPIAAWTGRLFATDVLAAGDYAVRTYGSTNNIRYTAYVTDADLVVKSRIFNQSSLGWSTAHVYATVSEGDRIAIYIGDSKKETFLSEFQVEAGTATTNAIPFENICPISGWDSLTVYHSGADTSDPQTISIPIGQTVYSGWVDAVTGIGEITWAKQTFNGTETWTRDSSTDGFYRFVDTLKKASNYTDLIVCDKLKTYSLQNSTAYKNAEYGITGYIDSTGQYVGQNWIYAKAAGASTKEEFQAWLAENPIDVVYELATPIPIQLTTQEINSLAGDNVMWTDAQNLEVTYRSN